MPDSDAPLEPSPGDLSAQQRRLLLDIAWASIRHGLAHRCPLDPDPAALPERLGQPAATFVTLQQSGALRGCIGRLEAARPLAQDVAQNAYAAAFQDPRFPPLAPEELASLTLHISVLTPPEPMRFTDEADLLRQLRPGIDGLILEDSGMRGTFLPSVWEQLPEPADFLAALRRKAGLPRGHWSDRLAVARYRTLSFGG